MLMSSRSKGVAYREWHEAVRPPGPSKILVRSHGRHSASIRTLWKNNRVVCKMHSCGHGRDEGRKEGGEKMGMG